MIHIKEGVKLNGLSVQALLAVQVANSLWHHQWPDLDLVITSGTDSKHGRASKHYIGNAIDLRTHTLPGGSMGEAATRARQWLADALGSEYDVVLESDHIHIEWDPK